MNGRAVKVSVLLPEAVHRQLKLRSFDCGMTLQTIIAEAIHAIESSNRNGVIDSLSLVASSPAGDARESLGSRTVKTWQTKLKRILESGNKLAILSCTANIEAMETLIAQASEEISSPVAQSASNGHMSPN